MGLKGKGARETGGWILGCNWDKSLKSFPPCYSHLLVRILLPPLGLKLACNVNIVYGNLKSENSQDHTHKPQRNCTFMNSASVKGAEFLIFLWDGRQTKGECLVVAGLQANMRECRALLPTSWWLRVKTTRCGLRLQTLRPKMTNKYNHYNQTGDIQRCSLRL